GGGGDPPGGGRRTLGCSGAIFQPPSQAEEAPNRTPVLFTQFSGGWYSIGLASDAPWFQEKKAVMKMRRPDQWAGPPRCGAERPPGASLAQPSVSGRQDQCETRKSSFLRTEQPGLFSYTSPRERAPPATLGRLGARREKFRQAALAEGLAPEDVLILPQTGMSRGGAL
uniref:Uncharacterized protein n=1 Tax=Varanus komodoensis TaxID=61221 RepID=A0A8D2J299_VARKO